MDVVTAVCTKLASIFDRLAHESTSDIDALQTIAGLKRITKGEMPSRILQLDPETRNLPQTKQVTDLRRRVAQLRAEKDKLEAIQMALRSECDRLKAENDHIKGENDVLKTGHGPQQASQWTKRSDDAHFTYAEVMDIIRDKFNKLNGGFTLWADYSNQLHSANPSVRLLTPSKLQSWRMAKKYPAWAVNQLIDMPPMTRTVHKWSDEDLDFLVKIHLADSFKSDEQLAAECSVRFGCSINTNSIKSKFNILRKQGRIPLLRPERPH